VDLDAGEHPASMIRRDIASERAVLDKNDPEKKIGLLSTNGAPGTT
jgi:hypothetical protein